MARSTATTKRRWHMLSTAGEHAVDAVVARVERLAMSGASHVDIARTLDIELSDVYARHPELADSDVHGALLDWLADALDSREAAEAIDDAVGLRGNGPYARKAARQRILETGQIDDGVLDLAGVVGERRAAWGHEPALTLRELRTLVEGLGGKLELTVKFSEGQTAARVTAAPRLLGCPCCGHTHLQVLHVDADHVPDASSQHVPTRRYPATATVDPDGKRGIMVHGGPTQDVHNTTIYVVVGVQCAVCQWEWRGEFVDQLVVAGAVATSPLSDRPPVCHVVEV